LGRSVRLHFRDKAIFLPVIFSDMGELQDEFLTASREFDAAPNEENMARMLAVYKGLMDKLEEEDRIRFVEA
jgi:hypothetical protein